MGYFPFFVELEGKEGLIVGGGRIAAHKIEKIKPFGAKLTVVAPYLAEDIKADPILECKERPFLDADVDGKCFVIAATDDEKLNAHISALCQEKNILVNVVDDQEKCGFIFPSLVKEGKFCAGISTEGASPMTAAYFRSRLAAALPEKTEEILDGLLAFREPVKREIPDGRVRAAVLKEAALFCLDKGRPLTKEEMQERLKAAAGKQEKKKTGSVALVGAGCGAYDAITVKGLNTLRRAEVLIYDDLIDERLLSHVSESCEQIYVGKRSGRHSFRQEEINDLLVQKAREGKRVVRLKGGDPFVFGRGSEEMIALRKAKIPVTEIPGTTSAIVAPAGAGIPVTHRGLARSFHVITGHTAGTEDGLPEDIENLAALHGTLVFLMGIGNLAAIADKLIAAGKSGGTSAAVVRQNPDGSTQAVRGNLHNIAQKVKEAGIETPAVIVIGETAGLQLFDEQQEKNRKK